MKTGTLKKVLSIIIVSLVLALTITTIVLAVVPKKLYDPLNKDILTMSVWRDNVSNTYVKGDMGSDESNKVIEDVLALHEKSLQDNVLSTIFQGTGSYKPQVKRYGYSDVKSIAKKDSVVSLAFSYDKTQTLKINGEEYVDTHSTSNSTVTYTRAVMILTNSDSFVETTLYLCDDDFESAYQVIFLSHQSGLWDYILDIEMSQIKN